MFDKRTERFQEWPVPTAGAWPYDATADRNGNVWTELAASTTIASCASIGHRRLAKRRDPCARCPPRSSRGFVALRSSSGRDGVPSGGVDVSPDTKRIAVRRHDAKGGDIWVIEPRGSETHLTFDASRHNSMPVWSPDGNRIVYAALRKGKWGLYQILSSGSGTEELLFESDLPKAPMSWSPDGKRIVF